MLGNLFRPRRRWQRQAPASRKRTARQRVALGSAKSCDAEAYKLRHLKRGDFIATHVYGTEEGVIAAGAGEPTTNRGQQVGGSSC